MLLQNFRTFLQRLVRSRHSGSGKDPRLARRQRTSRAFGIERLEDRTMLSTFSVTTLNDVVNGGDGVTSLREAIASANAQGGADQISILLDGTVTLTMGELAITDELTITGNGQLSTFIDGNHSSRVINATLETGDLTLNDLTIQNGRTQSGLEGGGGIRFMSTGTLTLSHVGVDGNSTEGIESFGGGIFSNAGAVVLTNSSVTSNSTTGFFADGGGVASEGPITVTNSLISGNTTTANVAGGGGLFSRYSAITVNRSQVSNNSVSGNGSPAGGILTFTGAINVTDSVVDNNRSTGGVHFGYSNNYSTGGGGILSFEGPVTIVSSTVSNNLTGNTGPDNGQGSRGFGFGAGVAVLYFPGSLTVINSTISGNQGQSFGIYGAGLAVDSASLTVVNSTVANNTSFGDNGREGGGIFARTGAVTIQNSIVAANHNLPTSGLPGAPDLNPGSGTLTITNSLIGDNNRISTAFPATGPTPDGVNHNLIGTHASPLDPLLGPLAANGNVYNFPVKTMALTSSSPAINRGSDALALGPTGSALTTDERGSGFPRILGSAVDMGAFEFLATNPAVSSIIIPAIAPNPNSTGTVEYVVTFSKAVTGVVAGKFVVSKTGTVQHGTVAVTGSGATYTVTINSVTGVGTLGLQLLDTNGAIRSVSGNEALSPNSFTAPVNYNIVEVRSLSVEAINRAPGSTNPTSDSSVSFRVRFSEGVSGVAANQFTATKTNTVQTGTITVTPESTSIYTVTVSGITGLGDVGLNFQDNGNVRSLADNIGMTQSSFAGQNKFTIVESPLLFVQAIDFAPGGTSPTTASSVSFKVTFSSAVNNVAASHFTVIAGGSVASGTPQLTGSGKDYTVTVSNITGAGTLGLNFQDNGTIRRASDNQAMTTSTFTGAVYTIQQGTQGSTDIQVGGLQFHVVGGGNFSTAGSLNSATGQVQVGFIPTGGNPLTPLATLSGTVSIDTSTLNFSATGSVVAVIGGTSRTLFDNGVTNINIPQLLSNKVAAGGGKSLTVAGSTFTLSSFGFTNTSTPTITLQGNAVLPKGITVRVDGNNAVQINNSGISLSGATFSLTNSFSVGGTTFSADQLTVSYTTSGNVFALTGTAGVTIRDIGNMSVTFGSTGLVINNGVFSSLNATVNGAFTVRSVQIAANALNFSYTEASQQFSMSGTASVAVGGMGNLSVTFGHLTTPGLVVTNGELVSLDMTVNASFSVAGVTVTANALRFTYTAASNAFTLAGTAGIAISGIDDSLSVTFGQGGTPGLVITNGSLTSLDVTVNAEFHVARVTITATNLRFTYVASTSTFTMAGTAGFTISGIDDRLSVTFGEAGSPGLVVTNGALVSLDVTVNTVFHVARVTVIADQLRFTYVAATQTFTLSGTAGFRINGVDDDLSVTFGHDGIPGLVISEGALVSLDVKVNATFHIKKVTITAKDLEFTYVTATNRFTLSGTAGIRFDGIDADSELNVTFGSGVDHPGLVITDGNLESLDVIINADFKVKKVTIFARNLEFTYTASTNTFTLSGTAGITVGNFGANLSVTFGQNGVPGLVITDGTLESLDMTVNAGFRVAQVLDVNVVDLRFTYRRSLNQFTLSGGVRISPVGLGDLANVEARFGDANQPGLVIQDGNLVSMHLQVTANIRVSALTVSGQLVVDYTHSTRTIVISGTGRIAVSGIGDLNVRLGGTSGTQGLVIVNGRITTFNMTIDTQIRLAGVNLNGNLIMNYNSSTQLFVMTGNVNLSIGSIGNVSASLGGNGTAGLVIQNGSLFSLDMSATANFSVGPLGLNGTLNMSYRSGSGQFVMYGTAQGTFLGQSLFTVNLGNSQTPGLAISNGSLQNLTVTVSGNFTILGVPLGHVSLTASYEAARSRYFFSGTASVDLPSFIPDWLASALGGRTLASISVELNVIANNNRDSYFQAQASIAGTSFGFKKQFDGTLTFIGNPVLTTIANAVVTVVDAVVSAANAVADWFSSWWGPLEGATIYYDPAFNFDFANDPQSTSGADGRFAPVVPQGATSGQLVLVGGLDRSTGLVNALRLTAPYNSRIVSPLTSLLNQLMQQQGLGVGDAMTVVNQSLGMPMTTNLLGESLALAATGGDLRSARSFSREVEVGLIVHQASSLLSGLPGAPSVAELSTDGFAALASILAETGGESLDLADPLLIAEVIRRTAQRAELTIDPAIVDGAAAVIADVNHVIDTIPLNDATSYLNKLLQVQTVAQGTIVPQLAQVTAGQLDIATVIQNNTGAALIAQTDTATFGELNVIGPTISITPIVSQAVGAGQPSTFEFQVYMSSPTALTEPVSVHFATRDQTATAGHGDFDQTTGILTWQPGDTAPKTISIPVHATNSQTPNRLFTVELTDAVNAEVVNLAAIGSIAYSDFATSTTIATSDPQTQFGQSVTFTATVTNLDPQNTVPNQGTVTFYDGNQMLGSAPVVNGIAQFVTDDLTAEVHAIRATFSGAILTAERYQSSTSSPLEEVVGQISQSITFPSIPNVMNNAPPLVIDGFASSGLPLTFKLISGSASLNGNILTPVGPGPVVLQAEQSGDVNFISATPLTRTFQIIDSGNGLNDTAPVALDGIARVAPGSSVMGQLTATDAENDALTYGVGLAPEHGIVVVNEDGSFEYTPAEGFTGIDTFTFAANDGQLIGNLATITVTVRDPNLPPVADDGTLEVQQNGSKNGTLSAVTGNSGTLTYSQGALHAQHGTVTINPGGSFTYAPFEGYFGPDSFSFVANDGNLSSNAGTISITVTALAPIAQNANVTVQENGSLSGSLNASGGNGNTLTFSQGTIRAHHGLVTIQSNGSFTYTPAQEFAGTDSFSFVASDGELTSNNGLVTITVQPDQNTTAFELSLKESTTIGKVAVRLDSSASLVNVNPDFDFSQASIQVTSFNSGAARDTLAVLKGGGLTIKGTKIFANGAQVGTIAGGKAGSALRITFTGGTQTLVNGVLKAITAKAGKVKKGQPQNVRAIQIDVTAGGETRSATITANVG